MALGYAFGSLLARAPYREDAAARRRLFTRLGLGLVGAFLILRAIDAYGDPSAWSPQGSGLFTVLSFLNISKYPPSLDFLLLTLGLASLLAAGLERLRGRVGDVLAVYGRVPLFYYLLHLPLIHAAFAVTYRVDVGEFPTIATFEPSWGLGLPAVYAIWAVVVAALYLPCRWFAGVKARRREAWLSYL
jgi:uncharacterized membrane protein